MASRRNRGLSQPGHYDIATPHCPKRLNHLRSPEGPIKFTTLPGAIAQIVTNLVQNALVHAFPKKIGSIIFTCARHKDTVELRYEDNGAGMQPTTFNRFRTILHGQSGAGGSGLGLFIVHELVTGPLSGTIGLHSEPGQGTQIIMSWPYRPLTAPLSERPTKEVSKSAEAL